MFIEKSSMQHGKNPWSITIAIANLQKNLLEDWLLSLMSTLVMGFGPED
jgi:hypothetical protein